MSPVPSVTTVIFDRDESRLRAGRRDPADAMQDLRTRLVVATDRPYSPAGRTMEP